MYARGGRHIGFGLAQGGCEGTSYHGDWAYEGGTRFAKEQWHVSYAFTPYKTSTDPVYRNGRQLHVDKNLDRNNHSEAQSTAMHFRQLL